VYGEIERPLIELEVALDGHQAIEMTHVELHKGEHVPPDGDGRRRLAPGQVYDMRTF
jgi:hypothetical protein